MITQKFDFFFFFFFQKKFEFWLVTKSWNHLIFVNISPAVVIDTSMERSPQILQHRDPKISFFFFFFFFLISKYWILTCADKLKSPYLRQYQSYISNWYINGKVITSTTPWKPKSLMFFPKKSKFNFDLCWCAEITLASSISVLPK